MKARIVTSPRHRVRAVCQNEPTWGHIRVPEIWTDDHLDVAAPAGAMRTTELPDRARHGRVSEQSHDPVEQALGTAVPRVRKLRLALIAVLVAVLLAKAFGWIDPSWQLILWLTAATAIVPPLLVAMTAARNLEDPHANPDDAGTSDRST